MNGLLNSSVLDVTIGLIFIYLLLAIMCSAINEWIASWSNLRAKNLKDAITQLLDGQTDKGGQDASWFLKKFYSHPLITGMHKQSKPGGGDPAYLPSRVFASVVMDLVTPSQSGTITFQDLEKGIQNLETGLDEGSRKGDVRQTLLALIQNADRDLTKAQKNIETWFDDTMERMGGWYKRKIQIITIVVASVLVVGANADTIRMTYILWRNPTQRAQMVEVAKERSGQHLGASQDANNAELQDLDNLLGWGSKNQTAPESDSWWEMWSRRLLGWFLTVVAVSLGAPFWFDLLNKIVNLRNAGEKPKTSQQNSAEQANAPAAASSAPLAPPGPAVVVAVPGGTGQ